MLLSAGLITGCSALAASQGEGGGSTATTLSGDFATAFFDIDTVHSISIEYDESDYDAMIEAYTTTGEKEWISATVTIDGTTFENVGLRLKGNSSLRGLGASTDGAQQGGPGGFAGGDAAASADDPTSLPWLIRLDKYVDGQEYQGRADYVIRSNNSETSLNEAVALYVLDQADVQAEQAAFARVAINGGDEQLRLVLDLPDDDYWNEDAFGGTGLTFKADSTGDYSYRGDDSAAYLEVFDLEVNPDDLSEEEAYAPLIAFLQFINESTDEEFAAGLGDHLDVESFADYLAAQELVGNTDDIDGPGNNSYLHYDPDTGLFTVVAWDQNLSYGGLGGFGGAGAPGGRDGAGGAPGGNGAPPEGFTPPNGGGLPGGGGNAGNGGMGGPGGQSNALVAKFLADDGFSALYEAALERLGSDIYESGDAQVYLDSLVAVLVEQASDLVSESTIAQEADAISGMLTTG